MVRAGSIVLLLMLVASTAAVAESGAREIVLPAAADGPPFSGGVLAGDLLYLSGAIGNEPGTTSLRGSVRNQAEQTLTNLETVLAAASMDKSRITLTTVYVSDARLYPPIGRTLAEAFADDSSVLVEPTRTVAEAGIALPHAALEIAAVAARPGVEMKALKPAGWARPTTGYSWGVRAGDTVFVAAQAGNHPRTGALGRTVTDQTKQALLNIEAILAAGGLRLEHLVACRVYLADARGFAGMNEGWRAIFDAIVPPTRATIRARSLRPSYEVMIQCTAVDGEKKVVALDSGGNPPFSPALLVGDRLFLSGMVGRGPDGFPADLGDQTGVALDRLAAHLERAGMGMGDVVSVEVWLDDVRHYDAMNAVYRSRLPVPPPARATVASQLMSPDAKVEIAMVAVRRPASDD